MGLVIYHLSRKSVMTNITVCRFPWVVRQINTHAFGRDLNIILPVQFGLKPAKRFILLGFRLGGVGTNDSKKSWGKFVVFSKEIDDSFLLVRGPDIAVARPVSI